MPKPQISLIGAGAAGQAMIFALHHLGYPISAIASRSYDSAKACATKVSASIATTDLTQAAIAGDIVVIATPDTIIETVACEIAANGAFRQGQLVMHLSGALSSDALHAAAEAGADTLAFHPVQTLASGEQGAKLLQKAYFCLEGGDRALHLGRELAQGLSGKVITLSKEQKGTYHAALCIASNYLVTLEQIAVKMLGHAGIENQTALNLLMPLIQGAVDNLNQSGIPQALTGPISRGDIATLEKHLQALDQLPENMGDIYKRLGIESVELGRAKGSMAPGSEEEILRLLS